MYVKKKKKRKKTFEYTNVNHASNNNKALRSFKCLPFRRNKDGSTINCSITKCIQTKIHLHANTTYTTIYVYTLNTSHWIRRLCK